METIRYGNKTLDEMHRDLMDKLVSQNPQERKLAYEAYEIALQTCPIQQTSDSTITLNNRYMCGMLTFLDLKNKEK